MSKENVVYLPNQKMLKRGTKKQSINVTLELEDYVRLRAFAGCFNQSVTALVREQLVQLGKHCPESALPRELRTA